VVRAEAGILRFTGDIAQIVNSELTGGTWEVLNGASLLISRTFATNSAELIMHGTGVFGSLGTNLTTNSGSGSIQLLEGAALTLTKAFTNSGTLFLDSASLLTTTLDFTQAATGLLEFELSGAPESGQFGRLAVGGAAALNGTGILTRANGFVPVIGQSFPLATFGSKTGAFTAFEGTRLGRDLFLSPVVSDTSLVVNVVASPANAKTVDTKRPLTFTDADGDLVKVTLKGPGNARVILRGDAVDNNEIEFIDITGSTEKTNLTINVKGKGAGNGLISIGSFDASGLSLKSVKIKGDVGKIDIGEGTPGDVAIGKLTVNSLGRAGTVQESTINGSLGSLTIKKDITGVLNVTGGRTDETGLSGTVVNAVKKLVIGGNIDGSAGGQAAGLLRVLGDIGSLTVKGSVIGGADQSGIVAGGSIKSLNITGGIASPDVDHPVTISALGIVGATSDKAAVALKSLKVGGDIVNAEILAGYRLNGVAANPDAGIGKVVVKGSWTASSMAAGVADTTADGYGRNDALIAGGSSSILARIASITIARAVAGSDVAGTHFGITAEQVGELKLGKIRQPLVSGTADSLDLAPGFKLVDFA